MSGIQNNVVDTKTIEWDKLKTYEFNSLKSSDNRDITKLKNAIMNSGFNFPFYIWHGHRYVIDGKGRDIALHELEKEGYKIPPLPIIEIKADNKAMAKRLVLQASSNHGQVTPESFTDFTLDLELKPLDFEMFELGFDDFQLDDIDAGGYEKSTLNDNHNLDDVIDEAPSVAKLGDVFKIGNHTVMCGDATKKSDIEKLLNGVQWDCCVFDPPYEVESLYYSAMPKTEKNKKLIVFWDFKRFAIAGKSAIDSGWNPLYEFIWDNITSWYTPNRPLARHKACGVFGDDVKWDFDRAIIHDGKERKAKTVKNTRGECNYNPLEGAKHLSTVEQFQNDHDEHHKHQKPIKWLSAIFSGTGCNVFLDLFGGGGSTLIACEMINKQSFTMELDPKNVDIILKRASELLNQDYKLSV